MTFSQIFTSEYLLNPLPPQESNQYLPLLILFSFLIVLSVSTRLLKGDLNKLTKGYFYTFLTCGIFGLLYLFGRYEGLPWIGSRIILMIVLISLGFWTIYDLVWMIRFLPHFQAEKKRQERYEQYLPRPKTKK